jgi:uncharacterized membrane protein YkvA (DUF1232 family)
LAAAALAYGIIRYLSRREPYASFVRLRAWNKLAFFRLLVFDRRVPWWVRGLPVIVVLYIASPIDLLPGIFLDDVAFALLALVVIVRLTPREVIAEIIREAGREAGSSTAGRGRSKGFWGRRGPG